MDLHDQMTMAHMMAPAPITIERVAKAHARLIGEMEKLDPIRTAASFGALLTASELQSNCYRLEMLVHLAVTYCRGRSLPTTAFIKRAFEQLGT